MNDRPLTVFVLDDDPASGDVITQMVGAGYPLAEVKAFTDHEEFLNTPDLCGADMFILDIRLTNFDGRDLPALMPIACLTKPFLFVSGYPITDAEFDRVEGLVHFDFIGKPFQLRHFVHRLGVMLVRRPAAIHRLQDDLFDLMAHTAFVAIVIDAEFQVRYCNRQTLTLLEVDKLRDIVGRSWLDFIPDDAADAILEAHGGLISGDLKNFGEFVNDIQTPAGIRKAVKWFNTPFEGVDGDQLALSIGILATADAAAEEQVRRRFREAIMRDRANIRAVKRFAHKPLANFTCRLPQ